MPQVVLIPLLKRMENFIGTHDCLMVSIIICLFFQRIVNEFIEKYNLKGTYAYVDDITVWGDKQQNHDT